jgi:protocatechuate 3,4-dioxygenase beta subunit
MSHADAPQGVRGRVLLPDGRPAAGIEVMLLPNMMANPAQLFLLSKREHAEPPLAATRTGDDGSFTLGLLRPDTLCDLRILSTDYPEKNMPRLKVREGDWFQTGDVRLEVGAVVQGYVLEQETNAPVAGATVFLSNTNQAHSMLPTPGRERGIPTQTDSRGFYYFATAQNPSLVNLSVEAPGFASSPLLNQSVKSQVNEFTLFVMRGAPIAGVVIDPNGQPIRGATIQAVGLSSKTPQNASTVSDDNGGFTFYNLRSGPYSLNARMAGYLEKREPFVLTGDGDVRLVLGTRGSVKVRVLAASGAPVRSYRLGLTRYFEANPDGAGKVMDFSDRNVSPRDFPPDLGGNWALIPGLPPGDFRLMIDDDAHAKTLSEKFTIVEGGEAPEVVVQMTLGGSIVGAVIDDRGRPVEGAIVGSDMNSGAAGDLGGLFDAFRALMPDKHTKRQVRTDAQGRFRLTKLSFADYMVRVSHPSYCEGTAVSIKIERSGQEVDVGVIQLTLGAVFEGVTMVAGQPIGQVQVAVTTALEDAFDPRDPTPKQQQQQMKIFYSKAISDGDGRYRLLKRVPPGIYKVTASRHNAESPFAAMGDMKDTEQKITVAPGQERVEINFNLRAR